MAEPVKYAVGETDSGTMKKPHITKPEESAFAKLIRDRLKSVVNLTEGDVAAPGRGALLKNARPIELALLAALLDPSAIKNPLKSVRRALSFVIETETLLLQGEVQRTKHEALLDRKNRLVLRREYLLKTEAFASREGITWPKKFPVETDHALRLILHEKKTLRDRREVGKNARRALALTHPKAEGLILLDGVAKGNVVPKLSERAFWFLAEVLRPYRDKRKIRSKKRAIGAHSGS